MEKSLITYHNPKAPDSEAYRMLRKNIGYTGIDKKNQVILLTSSKMGVGKSTTAANLALAMAQRDHSVVLIDCDLRRPRMHKMFAVDNSTGLTDLLIKDEPLENVVFHSVVVDNLDIITSGVIPPMPSELLDSKKMGKFLTRLREKYDYIIIDSPPILSVTDATILSKIVDGVLLVVASNETHVDAIATAKKALDKVGANVLGSVLTKANISKRSAYYYDYDYGSKKR